MKKLFLMGIMVLTMNAFTQSVPEQKIKNIYGKEYIITISFIKEYNQAVFIFKTKAELFDESTIAVILEDEIEIFQKENGYFGRLKNKENPTLRYHILNNVEMIRYIKEVIFTKETIY